MKPIRLSLCLVLLAPLAAASADVGDPKLDASPPPANAWADVAAPTLRYVHGGWADGRPDAQEPTEEGANPVPWGGPLPLLLAAGVAVGLGGRQRGQRGA